MRVGRDGVAAVTGGIRATIAALDPALAVWGEEAERLCPDANVVKVLRHVPSRRLSALLDTATGLAILKVFANPRARGNARRLGAIAATPARTVVPSVHATDPTGHVNILEFVPGQTLTEVPHAALAAAAEAAGRQLRVLHECGARFDRTWSFDDELAQLHKTTGPRSAAAVERLLAVVQPPCDEPLVPAHRDCHPAQAIVGPDGVARWIDLDDAAMAPPGLDVGNFLAHVTRQEVLGDWPRAAAQSVRSAFTVGYGQSPPGVAMWEQLAFARLIALADTRHDSTGEIERLESMPAPLQ